MNILFKSQKTRFGIILSTIVGLFLSSSIAIAAGKTTQRPLDDFLSTQGEYCIDDGNSGCFLFVPPDPNFLGWSTVFDSTKLPVVNSRPQPPLFAGVDYAGLTKVYAPGKGPVFSGSVTERLLSDGRAEVTVLLRTKNANAWAIELETCDTCDLLAQVAGSKPTLFGHRPGEITDPTEQALADSNLHIRFINTKPGDPLPDLVQLVNFPDTLPGVVLKFLAFSATATGPLTSAYGVAENTPGKLTIVQTGLMTKTGQNQTALKDGFPVEDINLSVVGK